MSDEDRTSGAAYAWEELLSFDRMKRAVLSRVATRAEQSEKEGSFLPMDRLSQIVDEEWQRAKEAVRSSPQARQATREHLQRMASSIVDNLIQKDREELEAMGVVEKTL